MEAWILKASGKGRARKRWEERREVELSMPGLSLAEKTKFSSRTFQPWAMPQVDLGTKYRIQGMTKMAQSKYSSEF